MSSVCPRCAAPLSRRDALTRHLTFSCPRQRKPRAPGPWTCADCHNTLGSPTALKAHQKYHCPARPSLPVPSLHCPDCKQTWRVTHRKDYDRHIQKQACRYRYECPLCQEAVTVPNSQKEVCPECEALALQLQQQGDWDPVEQGAFGTALHNRCSSQYWTCAEEELGRRAKAQAPIALGLPIFKKGERRKVPPAPPQSLLLRAPGSGATGGFLLARNLNDQVNRMMHHTFCSTSFEQPRHHLPPHHRLQEPVSLGGGQEAVNPMLRRVCLQRLTATPQHSVLTLLSSFLAEHERWILYDCLLDVDRHSLARYQPGATPFCAHSGTWKAIQAHFGKCPGKARADHLWTAHSERTGPMVATDIDRYYHWFLSPQAAVTRWGCCREDPKQVPTLPL